MMIFLLKGPNITLSLRFNLCFPVFSCMECYACFRVAVKTSLQELTTIESDFTVTHLAGLVG